MLHTHTHTHKETTTTKNAVNVNCKGHLKENLKHAKEDFFFHQKISNSP